LDFHSKKVRDQEKSSVKQIRRITWIGMLINILLAVFKMLAGIFGHSHAVFADGIHSFSDTVTDVAVIVGSYYWSKPADREHPYGHKRLETTVAIFIGGLLLTAGVGIGWNAVQHLNVQKASSPGLIALFAAMVSIFAKEALYRWTNGVGRRINSPSLLANAWHHRLDAFSSIPVFIAVGVAVIFPAWDMLDHLAAFIVSIMICYSAVKIILSGFKELIDEGASFETCEQIKDIALSHPDVRQVHNIRTRFTGNSLHVDLHMVVDGSMTVYEGHFVAEDVKKRIMAQGPDVIDVVVHIEPIEVALPKEACE
jgi:cation diffusion facilitator family transporter